MISIIIPCYNNGNYLVKLIDCLRHQTSDDWELIVVDDGSTDDTPQVVEDAFCDLPNAYFYKRNRLPKGSVVCRNIGFEHAKGKYVCHLDADDLVSDTFVEKRQAFMEAHPEVDYASFPAMSFTDENNLPVYDESKSIFGISKGYADLLESFLRSDYSFSTWNNIYKREAIKDILWDEKVAIYTDFSFIVPCILKGLTHNFCNIKEIDYFYRVNHSSNAMTAVFVSDQKHRSTLYLYDKTLNSLKDRPDFKLRRLQFKPMISVHFERLLHTGNAQYLKDFLNLIRKNYSSLYFLRYYMAFKLSALSNYKKYPIELFFTLFCDKRKYLSAVKSKVSNIFK